jgi:hypothetical protein
MRTKAENKAFYVGYRLGVLHSAQAMNNGHGEPTMAAWFVSELLSDSVSNLRRICRTEDVYFDKRQGRFFHELERRRAKRSW